jgi:predicted PurR-regulated permease PerM
MSLLSRWRDFRRTQRETLRASNHPHEREHGDPTPVPDDVLADVLPTAAQASGAPVTSGRGDGDGERPADGATPDGATPDGGTKDRGAKDGGAKDSLFTPHPERYGRLGRPLNRQSPFYMGFFGGIGVLTALLLWHTIGRLTTTITLLVVAFFLTLALNPILEALTKRRVNRGLAVAIVFAGLIGIFVILGYVVVPPVISQGAQLIQAAPGWLNEVLGSKWIQELDKSYDVVDKVQDEFNKRITDSSFISQVFGGVLGVGAAVVGGIFQGFTVLVLTLFLLASFPRVKQAAFAMVPASRRPRVTSLSEEIMRRTGSYAIGQVAVASINAVCSYVMMTIVGIPYAAVLAVAVGFLGLIPMVGATIGAVVVCVVAVFDEPRKAIIAAVYFVIYQQVENYIVAPRVMQRTVSVPGAVTVIAALAGGTLLGVLGALLAIPVAAGLLLLYEEVLLPRQARH